MPDGSGLEYLPRIRQASSAPEVIIMTGEGDPDGAELAIRCGAWDYFEKPSSIKSMVLPLVRALQYREDKKKAQAPVVLKHHGIIGNSPSMRACLDLVAQAANSEGNVLVSGETGTGKELFAWAIHNNSPRASQNFVVVDCAALPETLVESILFGHEKGAFTGADRVREGLVKQADGGTLFLDEVGELPLSVQKSFLRVLQERRFRPVGGKTEVKSDFRLVAATNRDLERLVQKRGFREDLLYRLRSLAIHLPPLRERKEDIFEIAVYHVNRLSERSKAGVKGFSPDFFEALIGYAWPGNVRDLVNSLEIAFHASGQEPILFPQHLPLNVRIHMARSSLGLEVLPEGRKEKGAARPGDTLPKLKEYREKVIAEAEKEYLEKLHALSGGSLQESCRISGLARARLYELLKKHGMPRVS
jgi:two-component system NtrC family response regulator